MRGKSFGEVFLMQLRIATLQDVFKVLCLYGVGLLTLAGIVVFLPVVFCWIHICWIIAFFLYVIAAPLFLEPEISKAIAHEQTRRSERLKLDLVDWK